MLVKEFLRLIASHPPFNDPQVFGVRLHIEHGHLVSSPEILHLVSVDLLRSSPPFGRSKDDHWPDWQVRLAGAARLFLNRTNLAHAGFDGSGHLLVHHVGVVALDYVWIPSIPLEEMLELIRADAGKKRGIGDLVSVQMKNRQNRAIPDR